MTHGYSQRSLTVLLFLGLLSALMALLSVVLIFQLQAQRTTLTGSSVVPAHARTVLLPVSTVLSALSLSLSLSSVSVCLLHSYFFTEVCRGQDSERAEWFLLDTRAVRHVAVGLFCLGISVYLAAMSIYMLLVFEVETGITNACVFSSGILMLLITLIHSLVKASHTARKYNSHHLDTLYQNKYGNSSMPVSQPCELRNSMDKPQMHRNHFQLQHQTSYPPCNNSNLQEQQQHQQYTPAGSSQGHNGDKVGYSSGVSCPQMHRTLSTESGLLQAQTKPWNGVTSEMRRILAQKSVIFTKDSTLV
ncbi:transmembrane protein 221 [Thalassophryne amazonica]|uniref:transmembrane protein 221 n=1 Tax=Thalassophryne amazonica TaxID=390379 RepID=UPI0014709B48|nr:transmembrane protein 221 [Thalassophryne amazonica]